MTDTLPWHKSIMQTARPAPATLLVGDSGAGADRLALALAVAYCEASPEIAANPDIMTVSPEKNNIPVEKIRQMIYFLSLAPVKYPRRVAVILSAEQMNAAAANALLKTLEEPGDNKLLILRVRMTQQLPPTIVSRCRTLFAPRPDEETARQWLQAEAGDPAMLPFYGNLPLTAATAPPDWPKIVAEQYRQGGQLNVGKSVAAFAGKAAEENDWLDGLQKWIADGIRVAFGQPPRYFPGEGDTLRRLAGGKNKQWLNFYRFLADRRTLSEHPLAKDLYLREILHAYRQLCTN